ncbi:MAG: hypothetical protein LCH30_01195 [Proteobacteria bacterium]|nr:hypothetical protein [Pseudomonadota bacterium]
MSTADLYPLKFNYDLFSSNKISFFTEIKSQPQEGEGEERAKKRFLSVKREVEKTKEVEEGGEKKTIVDIHVPYRFLINNKTQIEQEFDNLFANLKNLDGSNNKEVFFLYCYYCCLLLKGFYVSYRNDTEITKYTNLSREIKKRYLNEFNKNIDENNPIVQNKKADDDSENTENSNKKKKDDDFGTYLVNSLVDGFFKFFETVNHASAIFAKTALANAYRIYWLFLKSVTTKFLYLSKDWQWLDKIANFFHTKFDIDNLSAFLNKPNVVFKLLSVAFFAFKFFIQSILLIKHTFLPSGKEDEIRWYERLKNELIKRHTDLLNDFTWFFVNLFTNYSYLFKPLLNISEATGNWITAGFLVFDFALVLWKQFLAYKRYDLKRKQYQDELLDVSLDEDYKDIIRQQLRELELAFNVESSNLIFNAAAALMIVAGFSAALIFTAPALILVSHIFCLIGVAMYLSAGAYKDFRQKGLELDKDINNVEAQQLYAKARKEFILTFSQNILMPSFFIVTCAFCWQAALALVVVYAAYKLIETCLEHRDEWKKKNSGDALESNWKAISRSGDDVVGKESEDAEHKQLVTSLN